MGTPSAIAASRFSVERALCRTASCPCSLRSAGRSGSSGSGRTRPRLRIWPLTTTPALSLEACRRATHHAAYRARVPRVPSAGGRRRTRDARHADVSTAVHSFSNPNLEALQFRVSEIDGSQTVQGIDLQRLLGLEVPLVRFRSCLLAITVVAALLPHRSEATHRSFFTNRALFESFTAALQDSHHSSSRIRCPGVVSKLSGRHLYRCTHRFIHLSRLP